MRNKFFTGLFLIFSTLAFSQTDRFSITFENTELATAISQIEKKTSYKFFYDERWFEESENRENVSGSYKDKTLDFILKDVLKNTEINFFIYDKKIILTNNNYIYDKLPSGFFGEDSLKNEESQQKPVFYQEFAEVPKQGEDTEKEELLFIGKEAKQKNETTFQLSGYVRNAKTDQPISSVLVKTKDGQITDVTDLDGYYVLNLPLGANIIQAQSLGFVTSTKQVMMYSDGTYNFSLNESINQLGEIVIYGDRGENIRSVVTGVTSIEPEKMKVVPMVLGVRDVVKSAMLMPGVKSTGEGAAGFNVRGGKTDQNLILLDEAVIYNPFHFFGFFSAVNPYAIGSLDIYKGSIPAEYGGRLSSVFDIQTKTPNMNKFSGEGGIGPVNGNLMFSIPIVKEKAALAVGGRYAYADWILRSLDEGSLKDSKASFFDVNLKYAHILDDKNRLEATVYYSQDKFNLTPDSLQGYKNSLVSLRWEHKFNNNHRGELQISNSNYGFDLEYRPDNPNSFDYGFDLNETKAKLRMNYEYSSKHTFTYGIEGKLYKIDPGSFQPTHPASLLDPLHLDEEKGLEAAVFLSDAFEVTDKLLLDAGIRYSHFIALGKGSQRIYDPNLPKSDASVIEIREFDENESIESYGDIEWRLSARYLLTEDFSVKAGYSTANQYIHLLSTNTTQSPLDTWKLSDLNLKPQSSQQYSLGFFKNFKNAQYELSLEGYYKALDNLVDYKTGADLFMDDNLETSILQGEGKSYGIEFLAKKNNGKLNGWLAYTYSRSFLKLDGAFKEEIVNDGDYFPTNFDKPHDFSLVLNYKLTSRYSFSANFIYQTGRPVTFPVGTYSYAGAQYTLYSDRNQYRIPDYYRLDIGFNIEGNHKKNKLAHSFINISVYNVLGRNNPYSVYFVTDDGQIKGYKTSIFSVPIPTITYNFKF